MSANNFLTNQVITYEALDVLENTDSASRIINKQYSDEFRFGGAVLGQTLSIRKPPRYVGRLGQAVNIEGIAETFVPLTLAFQRGVDTTVTSQDLLLRIDDYRERILKPQIVRVANLIDQDVCSLAQGLNNFVGVPGTTPTTLTTYLAGKTKLDNFAAPMDGERNVINNPAADASIMDNLKGLFQSASEIKEQYLSGAMGRTIGADWYMDQNIFVQTVGALGTTSNPIVSAGQSGSTITTTGWQAGAVTLNAGDIVSFVSATTPVNALNPPSYQNTGQPMQFVVTATTSDVAGTIAIPIAPALVPPGSSTPQNQNVTNAPPTGCPVFVYNQPAANFAQISGVSSPQNLFVHKDFGTLAMVDMPLPGGVDKAYRAASRKTGNTIRVIRDYVATSDMWIARLDVLYGTAVLRQEYGARVGG
jgi:hypothetical protein